MPIPAYMEVTAQKQGKIEGSCTQKGREGTIMVQAFEHRIESPRDAQSGQPTGQRMHKPLHIVKEFDKASPKLYQVLCTNENLKTVIIKWYRVNKTGNEENYFTIKLEDANIALMRPWMPNCLDPAFKSYGNMEEVGFTYRKITWTWVPDGIEAVDDWQAPA